VVNACRSVCGVTAVAIPARRAVVRTIRPAPCRSSRRPSLARNRAAGTVVDGPGGPRRRRDGCHLAARAGDRQGPVAALKARVLDVGAGGLRYPRPVQREQRDRRGPGWRPGPGGDEQRAGLAAVQRDHAGLVAGPRTADSTARSCRRSALTGGRRRRPRLRSSRSGCRGAVPAGLAVPLVVPGVAGDKGRGGSGVLRVPV